MRKLRIVLLSGPFKVGKSTVTGELVKEYGFRKISSSDYLRTLTPSLSQLDDAQVRLLLQEKGDDLDTQTDYLWVVDPVAASAIKQMPENSDWLIDAVRKRRQVEHFRAQFGAAVAHFHLVAPDAILKARSGLSDEAYELAINHSNEINSRALKDIADRVFDTSLQSPQQIAELIVKGDG
jgi:AAA domain